MGSGFHDVRFPLSVAFGATGGPERRTEVVLLGSGAEERNTRWAHSRRRYDAGDGVRTLADLEAVVRFFEERRGRLYGFRYHDPLDHLSCGIEGVLSPLDQPLATGDGVETAFQLVKRSGADHAPYDRAISKPVAGTVRVAVDGGEIGAGAFSVDALTGIVTMATAPAEGAVLTAGFEFDTAVRFDTDRLEMNVATFRAGVIPSIPIVEIRA
jgi:uncharacterized protein (TIGR02217 family)